MCQKFTVSLPLFLTTDAKSIKLEMKPYLQPFEQVLAVRELQALLNPKDLITEQHGYYLVVTDKPEEFLRQRLTYWQRIGRIYLEPTIQKILEFTQNGSKTSDKQELHHARRLRYGPHDIHEYRGKFFPQLVKSLVNISGIPDKALVLDPMCGSGTTPCEVLASGRSAIGADLNPLSVLIATVKSSLILERPKVFFDKISKYLKKFRFKNIQSEDFWSEDDLNYLGLWFTPQAINDLSAVLSDIKSVQESLYRDFFSVCLSNIIRSVSWQKETDLRIRKEVKSYDRGTAIFRFEEEVQKQLDKIYPYLCELSQSEAHPTLIIQNGNAVNIADMFPDCRGRVDLLVTSPPYATALPYLDTDRLSLIVLGLLPRKRHKNFEAMMVGTREVSERQRREAWDRYLFRKDELPEQISALIDQIAEHNHAESVGFRRRNLPALLGKYFIDMRDAMQSAHSLMAPGAFGYYVVGNNSTIVAGEKIQIPTDEFLFEIGSVAGWRQYEIIPMELLASRDIFKGNSGSAETILCFRA